MQPFTSLTAIAAPYFVPDVNTDQLLPHRFLRKPLSDGYRNFLFHDVRFTPDGKERPDFVLNREPYRRAGILLTGRNLGGGSARDGAVYGLQDFGFRAVIAPSYADIFKGICLQNGLLPVELPEDIVEGMSNAVESEPGSTITIDLRQQTVISADGSRHRFNIEPARKEQFLHGLDDIGLTLQQVASIEAFERKHHERFPWYAPSTQGLKRHQ